MPSRAPSRLTACIKRTALVPVIALLGACGGGGDNGSDGTSVVAPIGVAPEVAPSTYEVNPGASWKPQASSQDYFSGKLASVNLAKLGAGSSPTGERTVELRAYGSFRYNNAGLLSSATTGMFVDAAGTPVSPLPGTSYQSPSASADCGVSDLGDTIPQDFVIPSTGTLTILIPATAAELRLSVSDCYYKDNSRSDDPLRVTVKVL